MSKPTGPKSNAIQLSPHFFLSEFVGSNTAVRRGIDNSPNPIQVQNLFALAKVMELVRKQLGNKPIIISSGFRSPALNTAVGGARNSDHLMGAALDFTCPAFGTPLEICHKIVNAGIEFGQLICEGGQWCHLSLGTKREVLTATFENGRASYRQGL